jgi:hypothetical protein
MSILGTWTHERNRIELDDVNIATGYNQHRYFPIKDSRTINEVTTSGEHQRCTK